jgi:hypothetical protein
MIKENSKMREEIFVKELVGSCNCCGKEIFCLDGFLNGVHKEGKVLCFECEKEEENKE